MISQSRIGHLLATGQIDGDGASAMEAAAAALDAVVDEQLPKLDARLRAWAASIPAEPTPDQAVAGVKAYTKALTPFFTAIDSAMSAYGGKYAWGSDYVQLGAAPRSRAYPITQPYVALIDWLNDAGSGTSRLSYNQAQCAAQSGTWDDQRAGCLTQAEVAELNRAQAWAQWETQSAPLFAELDEIFKSTRDPYWHLDLSLSGRATELRDQLNGIAQQMLGAYGGPAWVGAWPQKNLARAQEQAQMAWQQAYNGVLGVAKVRRLAQEAGEEYGYLVDEYGNRIEAPGSGFGFGFPLAILGGIAAILLIRRARS